MCICLRVCVCSQYVRLERPKYLFMNQPSPQYAYTQMHAVIRNKFVAKCLSCEPFSTVRVAMHLACANLHAYRPRTHARGLADRLVIINMSSLLRCARCDDGQTSFWDSSRRAECGMCICARARVCLLCSPPYAPRVLATACGVRACARVCKVTDTQTHTHAHSRTILGRWVIAVYQFRCMHATRTSARARSSIMRIFGLCSRCASTPPRRTDDDGKPQQPP